jgi:hypothetical protein
MLATRLHPETFRLKRAAMCVLAIFFCAWPTLAQKSGGAPPSGGTGGGSRGTPGGGGSTNRPYPPPLQPGARPGMQPGTMDPGEVMMPTMQPLPKPTVSDDDACLPWDLAGARSASISATRLAVPGKARSLYQKACGAWKKNNLSEAEQRARDAIEKYPNYSAAWVMLGQSLEGQRKLDEAHDACTQPIKADPTYLPPYLCLAGLLNRQKKWDDLMALSDRFVGLNLVGDLYANYFRGLAQFHLYKLAEAQKSVLAAIALDTEHHQAGLTFLLAQIYGEQGDLADATAQIQNFVKYAKSKQDQDDAKEYLSELQTRLSAK